MANRPGYSARPESNGMPEGSWGSFDTNNVSPDPMISVVKDINANLDSIVSLFRKHTESHDGVLKDIRELLLKLPSEILKESKDRDERLQTAVDKVLQVLRVGTQLLEDLKSQQDDRMARYERIHEGQKSRDERKIQLLEDLNKGQDDLLSQVRENTSQYKRMIQALETNSKLLETNNKLLQVLAEHLGRSVQGQGR